MRSLICSAACAAMLAGAVSGAEPPLRLDTSSSVASDGLDDRSAPSTYQYDSPPYTGWLGSSGSEFVGVNAFDAVGGADLLTSISCVWRGVANGSTQRVFVWQDDGSGDPNKAKFLAEQSVVVANAGTTTANVYPLTSPIPVTGRFYVGFSSIYDGVNNVMTYSFDSSPAVPRRAFIGATPPPFNPALPGALGRLNNTQDIGFPGSFAVRADGNGSSFSYQGRLSSAGQNYTGKADFIFSIHTAESGGGVVGPPIAIANVPVNAGVFTVQIPADPSWFVNQPDRYLGVQVSTPADNGTYSTLTPRQRIGQVPAAMVATVAQSAQSVPWSGVTGVPATLAPWLPVAGGIAYTGGNVGIGTSTPIAPLHVRGGPLYNNALIETDSTLGTWLNLVNTSGTGRTWALVNTGTDNTEGAGAFLIRDNNVGAVRATFLPNGNVGLGTIAPTAKLDVRGDIRLGAGGEYQAIGASAENLSIIRGVANSNGTIRWGTGYTLSRLALGVYRVSWGAAPGFSGPPSATATAYLAGSPIVVYSTTAITNADQSGFVEFRTVNLSGVLTDSAFSFTLAGPR